jgi:hypothetical protein
MDGLSDMYNIDGRAQVYLHSTVSIGIALTLGIRLQHIRAVLLTPFTSARLKDDKLGSRFPRGSQTPLPYRTSTP